MGLGKSVGTKHCVGVFQTLPEEESKELQMPRRREEGAAKKAAAEVFAQVKGQLQKLEHGFRIKDRLLKARALEEKLDHRKEKAHGEPVRELLGKQGEVAKRRCPRASRGSCGLTRRSRRPRRQSGSAAGRR